MHPFLSRLQQSPRISRRAVLLGATSYAGASLLSGDRGLLRAASRLADPACTLNPELTEGPYYVDRRLLRQDITEGRPGLPLRLRITVLDANRCSPLRNAAVDLWHCDAQGVYSGYTKVRTLGPPPHQPEGGMGRPPFPPTEFRHSGPFPGGPGQPPRSKTTDNQTFFRGVQITGDQGTVDFTTIFPGWYAGRAVHIHMKVWVNGFAHGEEYTSGHTCHTGQLFFPEDLTVKVARSAPYRNHHIERMTTDRDHIFLDGGSDCVVKLDDPNRRSLPDAVLASTVVAVNPLRQS